MARLESFTKWRAFALLDPPYVFPKFKNGLALPPTSPKNPPEKGATPSTGGLVRFPCNRANPWNVTYISVEYVQH